jgi:hypothetical protein
MFPQGRQESVQVSHLPPLLGVALASKRFKPAVGLARFANLFQF